METSHASRVESLQLQIIALRSSVTTLEQHVEGLTSSKASVEDQLQFTQDQYNIAAGRAADLARENMSLEIGNLKLVAENTRLKEQIHTSVAQVRLTLQAEMHSVKEGCRQRIEQANLMIEQAKRSGVRLNIGDDNHVDVLGDELRQKAGEWYTLKRERDELDLALNTLKDDTSHRERVLVDMQDEERERKTAALRRCKTLQTELTQAHAQIELLKQEQQNSLAERPVPSLDDDLFVCGWVMFGELASDRTLEICGQSFLTREVSIQVGCSHHLVDLRFIRDVESMFVTLTSRISRYLAQHPVSIAQILQRPGHRLSLYDIIPKNERCGLFTYLPMAISVFFHSAMYIRYVPASSRRYQFYQVS